MALAWAPGPYGARVWRLPFRLEILCGDEVVVTFNSRGKLWFEPLQDPTKAAEKGERWFKPEEIELDSGLRVWNVEISPFLPANICPGALA